MFPMCRTTRDAVIGRRLVESAVSPTRCAPLGRIIVCVFKQKHEETADEPCQSDHTELCVITTFELLRRAIRSPESRTFRRVVYDLSLVSSRLSVSTFIISPVFKRRRNTPNRTNARSTIARFLIAFHARCSQQSKANKRLAEFAVYVDEM